MNLISSINLFTKLFACSTLFPNTKNFAKVAESVYDELVNFAYDIGVRNAFIQEGETQKESFIPNFNLENV